MSGHSHPRVEGGVVRSFDGKVEFDDLQHRVLRLRLTAPADGSENDTGIDVPDDAQITNVLLNVITAEATGGTKTVDVGLLSSESGGDADGFLNGVDVSSTGLVQGSLASGGQTLGALLSADEDGAGTLVPEPHLTASVTAKSVSYTAGSADFAELVADLLIEMWLVNDR